MGRGWAGRVDDESRLHKVAVGVAIVHGILDADELGPAYIHAQAAKLLIAPVVSGLRHDQKLDAADLQHGRETHRGPGAAKETAVVEEAAVTETAHDAADRDG